MVPAANAADAPVKPVMESAKGGNSTVHWGGGRRLIGIFNIVVDIVVVVLYIAPRTFNERP